MNVPTLQEWFSGYIQTLFSTGYLNRTQFKAFYVTSMVIHGFTSDPISFFLNNAMTTVLIMDLAMIEPEPDFPNIIAFAQHLADSARSIGALRITNLTVFLIVFAEVAHVPGCLAYLHMLTTEINALEFCFSIITEMETELVILGHGIPFNW